MKSSRRLALLLALGASLTLAACGGGGSDGGSSTDPYGWNSVTTLSVKDSTVGTGATADTGKQASVNYTGWLYNKNAADLKGSMFDSNSGRGAYTFTLGAGTVIKGFDQGVQGMKVGGKRTIVIPASLGYGSTGTNGIPGGAALVFDVELVAVK